MGCRPNFAQSSQFADLSLKTTTFIDYIIPYGSGNWLALARCFSFMWLQSDGGWEVSSSFREGFLPHMVEVTHKIRWLTLMVGSGLGGAVSWNTYTWPRHWPALLIVWQLELQGDQLKTQLGRCCLSFYSLGHSQSLATWFSSLNPGQLGQLMCKGRGIRLHFLMRVVSENLWTYFKSTHHGSCQSRELFGRPISIAVVVDLI